MSAETAFLRVAATAGKSAHTIFGDVLSRKEVSLMFSFFFAYSSRSSKVKPRKPDSFNPMPPYALVFYVLIQL